MKERPTLGQWVERTLVVLSVCIFLGWAIAPYLSELVGGYREAQAVPDGGVE